MKDITPRILKYVFFALAVLAGLLIHFVNGNLAALAEMIRPGSALWTHLVLLGVEAIALVWFWRGIFRGRRHLLLVDGATPEEEQAFKDELVRRMRDNPLILEAGITPEGKGDPTYLDRCLAHLKSKADEEIQQNARRIFLATALSQNGRLDALIVFVCLCRLIWRVSHIYNQRPHPREIAALYGAVVTTTFLALSLEELDIATEITVGFGEAFQAMAPAGLTASIPFAGKALQTFTASTVDGAANCYLALRAGIITRNAYAYGADRQARPSRAAVFREAGAQLLDMSHVLVDRLAGTLASNLAGVAKFAGAKTVQAGKSLVDSVGRVGLGIAGNKSAAESDQERELGLSPLVPVTVIPATLPHHPAPTEKTPLGVAGAAVGKGAETTWNLLSRPFRRKAKYRSADDGPNAVVFPPDAICGYSQEDSLEYGDRLPEDLSNRKD